MKFFAYGLLLLSAALLSESLSISVFDAKDDLKNGIDKLKEEAKKEIEKLKAEGKVALAVGLEAIEKKLEDFETQVEKLDPTTEVGKALLLALEGLVKKVEEDLKAEIKKISGSFYDIKDDLKKGVDELKKIADEEIKKLEKEGKGELAKGIEAVEKRVLDIESQLEKLNPTTEVGKAALAVLEGLLKKAEEDLEAEVKKLSGSFYDIKDDLKKGVDELKKIADEEIKKLEKEGKGELAKGIEAVEKRVLDIEAQLEKLNPTTEVGKAALAVLEGLLKKAEEDLEAEVKKLSGSFYDVKDDLKKGVDELKKIAEEEIKKLENEGKGELAKGIEEIEKRVLDIESQLEKLNPTTEVGKVALALLEGLLKKAEEELEAEVKKLSGSFYDAKDDLKKGIDQLKEEAKKEIEKLKSEGKAALAVGLETIEKKLEDAETQIEKLNPTTEVGKALLAGLEVLVKKVEEELKAEITKISGSFFDAEEDLKNELLIEGERIKREVAAEIEKLKKEGKTELAAGLQAIEKRVLDIESQLEKLNPTSELGKAALRVLEGLLKKADEELEAEIKKLSGSF